ncbi:sialate O-acetylesterase [Luteolibacter yonseiensis]
MTGHSSLRFPAGALRLLHLATLVGGCFGSALADVRLPSLFGDGMVLQRDEPVNLRGWADPGEEVVVRIGGNEAGTARGGDDRSWSVTLPGFPAGPVPEIKISGRNEIVLKDVLAGDVWVCSGQSNMEMSLARAEDGPAEAAKADHPQIRLFRVNVLGKASGKQPGTDCRGKWAACSPESVKNFSAAAYYFGRDLHRETGVPIGLVLAAVGGTPAENWTPAAALKADPPLDLFRAYQQEYEFRLNYHQTYLKGWEKEAATARTEGRPEPRKNPAPKKWEEVEPRFSSLYNNLIHPITPQAVKGVFWYQGETNAQRAYQYRPLLARLITSWRSAWQKEDLPFVIAQLPNFQADRIIPGSWAELREAQARVAREVPHCALAVLIDTAVPSEELHPVNKRDVGKRAALAALKTAYKRDVVSSGPTFAGAAFHDGAATVEFQNIGDGLQAAAGEKISGFFLAGEDRRFHPAEAVVEGGRITVRSGLVPSPVAVRYAWADSPICDLYNKNGLPAAPFRSDDWPGPTEERGMRNPSGE